MSTTVNYGNINTIVMFPEEIEYIVNTINKLDKTGMMVEWGCGGSTLKWLENFKDDQKLITIEHNELWYNNVTTAINAYFGVIPPHRFNFIFSLPGPEFIPSYGIPAEENPAGLKHYINPTPEIFNADIYFIDGVARAACLMSVLLNRKKKNSIIFIHDYSPRIGWYDWASQFCDVEFIGPTMVRLIFRN